MPSMVPSPDYLANQSSVVMLYNLLDITRLYSASRIRASMASISPS